MAADHRRRRRESSLEKRTADSCHSFELVFLEILFQIPLFDAMLVHVGALHISEYQDGQQVLTRHKIDGFGPR